MGKINRGILGGFRGRVANVVGSSWKGIETMRSLPISVTNPRTTSQVANRTRFSSIVELAISILSTLVKPLNDRFASGMSGYNLFCSRNKSAFNGEGVFVPANLSLSSGKLGDTDIAAFTKEDADTFKVTYLADAVGAYQGATDKAYLLITDNDGVAVAVSSGDATRADAEIVIVMSEAIVADTYHAYLAFLRADGTMVGNSTTKALVVA